VKVSRESELTTILNENFACDFLEVVNESHRHSVPENSETHFKVTLVSSDFLGKTKVMRHQAVYKLTAGLMQDGLHALALHLYLPEEWQSLNQTAPTSPNCMGGSKQATNKE
jgi:BolA protein